MKLHNTDQTDYRLRQELQNRYVTASLYVCQYVIMTVFCRIFAAFEMNKICLLDWVMQMTFSPENYFHLERKTRSRPIRWQALSPLILIIWVPSSMYGVVDSRRRSFSGAERITAPRHVCTVRANFPYSHIKANLFSRPFPDFTQHIGLCSATTFMIVALFSRFCYLLTFYYYWLWDRCVNGRPRCRREGEMLCGNSTCYLPDVEICCLDNRGRSRTYARRHADERCCGIRLYRSPVIIIIIIIIISYLLRNIVKHELLDKKRLGRTKQTDTALTADRE